MSVDVALRAKPAETRLAVVDCDIHPMLKNPVDIRAYLPREWQAYFDVYGDHLKQPFFATTPYPKATPALSRRDAWPENGGPPGSDLDFMRRQHLDAHNIRVGILQVLYPTGNRQRNLGYAAALCRAVNDWQIAEWTSQESRLRGSIMVSTEDAAAAVEEIERRAGRSDFAQLMLTPRNDEPLGRRRYWPMFEAASRHGLPIGVHVGGQNGHPPTAGAGHPSFYAEEHHSQVHGAQAMLTSLVLEGVLDRFPDLRFILVEAGLAWVPSLAWRLDRSWERFRDELPHLRRRPSEYIRDHFWFTTQPADEPETPEQLRETFDWIGWDKILYASDYPHWDFDDPRYALQMKLSQQERKMVFHDNACEVYRLG